MPFRNVICWDQGMVPRVIDTEATETSQEVFLATHHPVGMFRNHGLGARAERERITQAELRAELLDPAKQHAHVVVQGTAGSGKSHLIRWLFETTQCEAGRRVLLIRKSGTNLKRIVESILAGLDGPEFEEYRSRLARATDNLTLDRARIEFLDRLAVAVGEHGPGAANTLPDRGAQEEREDLMQCLPALLHDDAFRRAVVGHGGIVDQIAEHVLGNAGRERRDTRRRFEPDDIPLTIRHTDLTRAARDFYQEIVFQPEQRGRITDWINANIDWAMLRMLDFSGDDISQLMLDVRQALAARGQELVLLIEDFARLQGIDTELLEALLVRPTQDGRVLCVLRSAIAVTTGYYASARDTVRARTDLVVDLDVPATGDMVANFSARYLNAVRLPRDRIRQWYEQQRSDLNSDEEVPNACRECEHRDQCHAAFGAKDGRGLYPFTAHALRRMFNAYTKGIENRSGAFNPRDLLNHVIKHTLTHNEADLVSGVFPGAAMLAHFGGRRMPAVRFDDLRRSVPADRLDQYLTLYELWGDPEQLRGVSPEVLAAFGLPERSGSSARDEDAPDPVPTPGVPLPPVQALPSTLLAQLAEIDRWANGGSLSQGTSQALRERLHPAVDAYTDWDGELLVGSFYVGATDKAFRRTSIDFKRQSTGGKKSPVTVVVPLGDDFDRAALALQGCLLYEHHGHWAFERGSVHLRAYLDLLDELSAEVLRQVRRLPSESQAWDPVGAAVELLTIGARLFGKLPPTNATIEQRIDALFSQWQELAPGPGSPRSTAWRKLATTFAEKGTRLADILASRVACTKGGRMGLQILDVSALLDSIELTRAGEGLGYAIPEHRRQDYIEIWEVRARADQLLADAITSERQRHLEWLTRVREHIGKSDVKKEVIAAAGDAYASAASAALLPSSADAQLHSRVVERFRQCGFEKALDAVEGLAAQTEGARVLALLGRIDQDALVAADEFLKETAKVLSGVQREVQRAEDNLSDEAHDVRRIRERVRQELDSLMEMLEDIGESQAVGLQEEGGHAG